MLQKGWVAEEHTHMFWLNTARRWLATCAAYRLAGKHIIACSHLTCQNSRAPRPLIFEFTGFELLGNKVKEDEMKNEIRAASLESHWEHDIDYGHL